MTLFIVSKIDIRRLNQTAVRPNSANIVLFPNDERANNRLKNRKKEKAKPMCDPDLSTNRNSNLKIIGVNFKDDKKNAMEFLKEMGNPFFILTKDLEGKKSVNFGIYGIPETILINKDLKILKKYVGPLSDKDVREIQRIIKK